MLITKCGTIGRLVLIDISTMMTGSSPRKVCGVWPYIQICLLQSVCALMCNTNLDPSSYFFLSTWMSELATGHRNTSRNGKKYIRQKTKNNHITFFSPNIVSQCFKILFLYNIVWWLWAGHFVRQAFSLSLIHIFC